MGELMGVVDQVMTLNAEQIAHRWTMQSSVQNISWS
jgi:hypothetical protein